MFSNYLQAIEGVEIYPIISLLIFFIFFMIMLLWNFKVDKNYLKEMEELPLDTQKNMNNKISGDYNGE